MQSFFYGYLMKRLMNWKFLFTCNLLILIIKISFSIYNHFEAEYFEDWSIAKNLTITDVYSLNLKHGGSAYKLPVYIFFLSFYMKIFGVYQATKFIIITQHIFYFIIPVILVKFFENFRLKNAGFLSAYFFMFSPAYFYYSNVLEATNIFILLFVIWMYVYSLFWRKKSILYKYIIALAILSAIVFLTQVVAIPVVFLLLLALYTYKRISMKNLLTLSLGIAVFYSPWVIRNYITFEKIIISKSPVWQNVYLGYIPDYQILKNNNFVTENEKYAIFNKTSKLNEFEDEYIYKDEVEKIVGHDKLAPYKKGLNNLISLWFVPKKYFDDNGLFVLVGRKLYVILINILLLASLIYLYKKNKRFSLLLCFLFAGFTIPYLIGHAANVRFKLDFEWMQTSVIALYISLYLFKDPYISSKMD